MGFLDFAGQLGGQIVAAKAAIKQARINADIAARNTDMTNAANREMAEYEFSKNLEMWNKQNAYNSPESQMERFKAAGLNPNLIYGQGNAGNASTLPRYSAPTQSYNYKPGVDLPAVISAFQDMTIKKNQITGQKLQNRLLEIQASKDMADAYKKWGDNMPLFRDKDGNVIDDPGVTGLPVGISNMSAFWTDYQNKYNRTVTELGKTQLQIEAQKSDNAIKSALAAFYQSNGKWAQVLLPFIKIFAP